jgi:hypothetical protein
MPSIQPMVCIVLWGMPNLLDEIEVQRIYLLAACSWKVAAQAAKRLKAWMEGQDVDRP